MTAPVASAPVEAAPRPSTIDRPEGRAIIGLSADYHDAAAALVIDGEIVAAAAEERFSRRKHDPDLPEATVAWLIESTGLGSGDLDAVAFYAKPLTTLERVLASHGRAGPRGVPSLTRALAVWARRKAWLAYRVERMLRAHGLAMPDLLYAEHHQSHAAAAFHPSPFPSAAVLTFDGVGEWATSTLAHGRGADLEILQELRYPDSVGLWYSTMTAYCGFEVNDGEYKLMGLAPYGEPTFEAAMRDHLIHVYPDGSVRLDQRWYRYLSGAAMFHSRMANVLGGPARLPDAPLTQREADIARSAQVVLEDIVLRSARHAHELTGERRACLAGGVALNCVANRRLREDGPFEDLWIQPASGDDGGAIGAALWATHQVRGEPRQIASPDGMGASLLGPSFSPTSIERWLRDLGIAHTVAADDDEANELLAERLARGQVVGCLRGRMEFGPRALGNRSILADPRNAEMIATINRRVKGREGFRPFAPAVLEEEAAQWFDLVGARSPYMLETAGVRGADAPDATGRATFADRLGAQRSPIGACTHVDGSARVQTVDRGSNPAFHGLIEAFARRTGVPALLNTSFNVRDEPIVATPHDALDCFGRAALDVLLLERCIIERPGPWEER